LKFLAALDRDVVALDIQAPLDREILPRESPLYSRREVIEYLMKVEEK
jgi:hypothetical protein